LEPAEEAMIDDCVISPKMLFMSSMARFGERESDRLLHLVHGPLWLT
jgi:hypothetical protein